MGRVLHRMWMQHRLNTRHPLCLLRWVAHGIGRVLYWGHVGYVCMMMMILRFFIEVRNANSAVFVVVVGTVVLLLLRGPICLCEILQALLHALYVQGQY